MAGISTKGAKYKLELLFEKLFDDGYFTSNARSVRNVFEETIKRQANRLSKCTTKIDIDALKKIVDKDIPDEI